VSLRILAAASPGEVRVAAVEGERLVDYAIWRPARPDGVGDLHRGRVIARVPAMAGAFLAVAGAEGFLPDSEGGRDAPAGSVLGVRITRAAQGGKGPRLTARLMPEEAAMIGAGSPELLRRGPSALARLAALHPAAPVLADDPALVAALRSALGERVRAVPAGSAFDDAMETAVADLAEPVVALPGGGAMTIEPTRALVAIDLDAGAATAERRTKAEAQAGFNRAALPALAAAIRLRNLSGAILVDVAGMRPRARAALAPALAAALASDPLRPRLLGFTALGLAEIVRPRIHPPLHEMLAGPHAAGLAALRALAREAAARPGLRPVLVAAPDVVAALQADQEALADLARRAGHPLMLRSDPALAAGAWMMEAV
jgi:Ribonuclease G/E